MGKPRGRDRVIGLWRPSGREKFCACSCLKVRTGRPLATVTQYVRIAGVKASAPKSACGKQTRIIESFTEQILGPSAVEASKREHAELPPQLSASGRNARWLLIESCAERRRVCRPRSIPMTPRQNKESLGEWFSGEKQYDGKLWKLQDPGADTLISHGGSTLARNCKVNWAVIL